MMGDDNKKGKEFARRTFILGGMKGAFFMALVGRLYYLQIVRSEEYVTLSDSNRIKLFLIPPLRGRILDRQEQLLAGNRNYYRILYNPEGTGHNVDKKETLTRLAGLLELSKENTQQLLDKVHNYKAQGPLLLHQYLTWDEVVKIEVHAPDLPGIFIDVGQIRYYPLDEVSSHFLGYLGPVGEKEIKQNPLLNHPDFKIGKSGIELACDTGLRGQAGVKKMEVNAFGLVIRELSREPSTPGKDMLLTIDKRLQEFAGQRLKGMNGCIVVADTKNGEILSWVSSPGFDANKVTSGAFLQYWQSLNKDVNAPLINRPLASQYPPGSTFKLVMALAALRAGVNPEQEVFCPGYVTLGSRTFHCWKEGGHGSMNLHHAVAQSCNAFFYTIAKKIGVEAIEETAREMGFGQKLGIELAGEMPGLVPSKQWKLKKYNDPWQMGDTLNIGIGQGFMLVTPLQLAFMAARLASGKKLVPHLTFPQGGARPVPDLAIPVAYLDIVRGAANMVVNEPFGTAYGSRVPDENFAMAGKTGTVQVVSKKYYTEAKFSQDDAMKSRREHHALFVGFAPVGQPRYAISVLVEHGGGGASAAAPVARDVLWEAHKLNIRASYNEKKETGHKKLVSEENI